MRPKLEGLFFGQAVQTPMQAQHWATCDLTYSVLFHNLTFSPLFTRSDPYLARPLRPSHPLSYLPSPSSNPNRDNHADATSSLAPNTGYDPSALNLNLSAESAFSFTTGNLLSIITPTQSLYRPLSEAPILPSPLLQHLIYPSLISHHLGMKSSSTLCRKVTPRITNQSNTRTHKFYLKTSYCRTSSHFIQDNSQNRGGKLIVCDSFIELHVMILELCCHAVEIFLNPWPSTSCRNLPTQTIQIPLYICSSSIK
jgi:hypothetical protein